MPNCQSCGTYIKTTEVHRREMHVGTTNRVYYGKRVSFNHSNHFRNQNVCANCAIAIDKNKEKRKNRNVIVFLVIAISLVAYLILK